MFLRTGGTNNRVTIDATGNVGIGTATPTNLLTVEGTISIREVVDTPAATTNYGKIYTKSDNKLWFQSGDGVEHEISYA